MDVKKTVQQKYGDIAKQSEKGKSSCCSSGCSDNSVFGVEYSVFNESYEGMKGYNADADLGLGCGLPTEFANIKPGDRVVDLGSGAGNDCFVARSLTGESGTVTGLDFTPEMVEKAKANAAKLGYSNVHFVLGDIENMPLAEESTDVVVSNCVLNLVPDKKKAFAEIYRILSKSGHFCVSDVVLQGQLPEELKNDMVMYAGCVAGAIQQDEYLDVIRKAGFENVQVKKLRRIEVPAEILKQYISDSAIEELEKSGTGIFSITVTADKPGIVSVNNYNYELG